MLTRIRKLRRTLARERGAVAIVFALCAAMLMAAGALAVDLGNAYQRKQEVQSQADMAALAAAASLPDQAAVLTAVCKNAVLNPKVGQTALTCSGAGAVQSSTTGLANPACPSSAVIARKAYVYFFSSNKYRIKVCSPPATVGYGLARILPGTSTSVDVVASATVAAGSPGAAAEMPYYTVESGNCSWGYQALTDPAHGQSVDLTGLPSTLTPPTASPTPVPWTWQKQNALTLNTLTPTQIDVTPTGVDGGVASITGKFLSKVTRVGLYRETAYTPNKWEFNVPTNSDTTGNTARFTIPATVANAPGLWYVRLFTTETSVNKTGWSETALVLRVGDPLVTCPDLSSSGNFGSLKLPRWGENNSTSNGWMPNNIAGGLKSPFGIVANPALPQFCDPAVNPPYVYSPVTGIPLQSDMHPDTNCVVTDTGLTATATTAGLITGTPLFPNGRLGGKATSTGVLGNRDCGPGGSSTSRVIGTVNINNDTLTCFMTNPDTTIDTIAKSTYSGPAALDPAIFDSPRFCYVPVIRFDASRGASQTYSVVDMRPCFITGEANSSTWKSQTFDPTFSTTPSADNGITMKTNKVQVLGVVLFNRNALPATGGGFGNYIGVGPVSVQMVD